MPKDNLKNDSPTLADKLAKLQEKSPRDLRMIESFVDLVLLQPKVPTGNLLNRWAFMSYGEYEVFRRACNSVEEIADKGSDKRHAEFPQDTLLMLHTAMFDTVYGELAERFSAFSEYDREEEGAA